MSRVVINSLIPEHYHTHAQHEFASFQGNVNVVRNGQLYDSGCSYLSAGTVRQEQYVTFQTSVTPGQSTGVLFFINEPFYTGNRVALSDGRHYHDYIYYWAYAPFTAEDALVDPDGDCYLGHQGCWLGLVRRTFPWLRLYAPLTHYSTETGWMTLVNARRHKIATFDANHRHGYLRIRLDTNTSAIRNHLPIQTCPSGHSNCQILGGMKQLDEGTALPLRAFKEWDSSEAIF